MSSQIEFNPDLVDESNGRDILIPAILFSVLIILSTGLRIFSKLWFSRRLAIEDFLIIIAFAFNLTGNILEIQCVGSGWGRHLQFLDKDEKSRTRMLTLYIILVANISLWAVKLSISIFLLSLITAVHRRAKWLIYGLITIVTAASFSQIVVWALQARPLEKAWHPEIPGTIASPYVLIDAHIASQVIGAVTDMFYALSPIYFFGKLQMSVGKKIFLISLTGSGLVVFAISVCHLAFVDDFIDPDYTWALHRVFIFALVERNMAEIIANLPVLTPLFRSMYKHTKQVVASYTGRATKISGSEDSSRDKGLGVSVATIGSAGKSAKKGAAAGKFQSYGKNAQFSELNTTSDEQIELWDGSQNQPATGPSMTV